MLHNPTPTPTPTHPGIRYWPILFNFECGPSACQLFQTIFRQPPYITCNMQEYKPPDATHLKKYITFNVAWKFCICQGHLKGGYLPRRVACSTWMITSLSGSRDSSQQTGPGSKTPTWKTNLEPLDSNWVWGNKAWWWRHKSHMGIQWHIYETE